ncbi:hypothetical protein ACEWY4_006342 [Coilia grayii]|uniref:PARP catalytic domain-containing protein n=1 Tax=Coilia grayii TaxID=363190 RepID=A0ABD1KD55_9TELE
MGKSAFGKYFQKGQDYKQEPTYIMYHGTTMKAARKIKRMGFLPSSDGMLGRGVYVSRSFRKAACYPRSAKGQERAVLKLSVRVGRVKKIDKQGHPLQKNWHKSGYDTAWVPPNCGMVKSGRQENCVWDPRRIRVLSIQSSTLGGREDESTDEDDDDEEEEEYDDEEEEEEEEEGDRTTDTHEGDSTDEKDSVAAYMSHEEATNSGDERSSSLSRDDSGTDEYVDTDSASPDDTDDRSSSHSTDSDDDDDDDGEDGNEASDREGSKGDESDEVFTESDTSEPVGEHSDEYYGERSNKYHEEQSDEYYSSDDDDY